MCRSGATTVAELAAVVELGHRLLTAVVAMEAHAPQRAVRMPAACHAHRGAVAQRLLAQQRIAFARRGGVLAGQPVAVAALVDTVLALEHADAIFRSGEELVATLKGRPQHALPVLRVGSAATPPETAAEEALAAVWASLGEEAGVAVSAMRIIFLR